MSRFDFHLKIANDAIATAESCQSGVKNPEMDFLMREGLFLSMLRWLRTARTNVRLAEVELKKGRP